MLLFCDTGAGVHQAIPGAAGGHGHLLQQCPGSGEGLEPARTVLLFITHTGCLATQQQQRAPAAPPTWICVTFLFSHWSVC